MARRTGRTITGLALATLCLLPFSVRAEKRIVAYVPNWVDLSSLANSIDYAKLTHLNIAFENPRNLDGDLSFNAKNESLIVRARTNGVKILVSIGGGSASTDKTLRARYDHLLNQTNRAAFVSKLANYLSAHSFDGLDVDIEGPAINQDYGDFIRDLAGTLKPRGRLLTAALSKGYGGNRVPDSALAHFDFVNIMAYDGTGPWSPQSPGQHSSFEFATNNVAYWIGRGLPKNKAVLGVPFYGYGFGEAARKRDYPYKAILAEFPGAEKFDQVGNTIWYNGIPTIKAKSRYVMEQGLGGIMIWSLDSDVSGEHSLLSAIHDSLYSRTPP
jgi:chitinase